MLELDGKKLAYQHPDLKQLESKKEAAYFLHRQVSLPWIQRAALEGMQAAFIATLIQWKSVLNKRQTVSLTTYFLDQFGISRGIKLRSLKLLEKAGLILLSKASGKSLRITLFSYPTKQNSMEPYHRGVITEPQHLFFLPPLIDFHTQSNLVISHLIAY